MRVETEKLPNVNNREKIDWKECEQNLWERWAYKKRSALGWLESQKEVREGGAEKIFEEIMAKYSPNLKGEWKPTRGLPKKSTLRHFIFKLKSKDKKHLERNERNNS